MDPTQFCSFMEKQALNNKGFELTLPMQQAPALGQWGNPSGQAPPTVTQWNRTGTVQPQNIHPQQQQQQQMAGQWGGNTQNFQQFPQQQQAVVGQWGGINPSAASPPQQLFNQPPFDQWGGGSHPMMNLNQSTGGQWGGSMQTPNIQAQQATQTSVSQWGNDMSILGGPQQEHQQCVLGHWEDQSSTQKQQHAEAAPNENRHASVEDGALLLSAMSSAPSQMGGELPSILAATNPVSPKFSTTRDMMEGLKKTDGEEEVEI